MSTARVAGPVAVLALLLGGCGGGESDRQPSEGALSSDEQTAADNLAGQIMRSESVSGGGKGAVTEEQARCIAEGAVVAVGLEALQGYGIVTDDLKVDKGIRGVTMVRDDADALAGTFVDCIDAESLFEEQVLDEARSGRAPEVRRCVERAVDSDAVRAVLSASFQGRTTGAYDRLQEQVSRCTGEKRTGK